MRICVAAFTCCLVLAGSSGSSAQEVAPSSEFFPTAVGTQWVYRSGVVEVIEKVTAHEKIGNDVCARVDTILNGKPISFEHITVRPDGVYRVAVAGQPIEPAFRFLKLPPKLDDTWTVKSKLMGQPIECSFKTGQASVEVPAGKYPTLTAAASQFKVGENDVAFTYYFAKGIGKVKQVTRFGGAEGREISLELKEFTAASQQTAQRNFLPR